MEQAQIKSRTLGVVRVIACGGIGTDNVLVFEEDRSKGPAPGYARIEPCYVDTSDSDLSSDIPLKAVYRLEKKNDGTLVNGSGKLRQENGAEIMGVIKAIVEQFKPGDLTIVVSSTSGGTGSVFGPFLVKELLDLGLDVVAFGIGTTGDPIEINNNIKTVKSYDNMARLAGRSLPFYYDQYGDGRPAAEVRERVAEVISGLTVLYSGQNKGIDGMDLHHWINPTKVVGGLEPKLLSLHMIDSQEQFEQVGQIISVASLGKDPDALTLPSMPDYRIRGISDVEATQKPVHFIVSDGQLIDTLTEFEATLADANKKKAARVASRALTSETEQKADPSGIIW